MIYTGAAGLPEDAIFAMASMTKPVSWIGREKNVCAVLMSQMLPFGDPGVLKLVEDFDRGVYRTSGPRPPTAAAAR